MGLLPGARWSAAIVSIAVEAAVLLVCVGAFIIRQLYWKRLSSPWLVTLLLALLCIAGLSIAIAPGNRLESVKNANSIFRFVPLAFLGIWLRYRPREIRCMVRLFASLCMLQITMAVLQFAIPAVAKSTTVPHLMVEAGTGQVIAAAAGAKAGAVYGLAQTAPEFALLLGLSVILAIAYLSNNGRYRIAGWSFAIMAFSGILLSYKRGAAIIAILIGIGVLLVQKPLHRTAILLVLLFMFTGTLALSVAQLQPQLRYVPGYEAIQHDVGIKANFESLLTEQFWKSNLRNSRAWAITVAWPRVMEQTPLLGYGPNESASVAQLIEDAPELKRLDRYRSFADVQWIAINLYFGTLFVALFLIFLLAIFKRVIRMKGGLSPGQGWIQAAAQGAIIYAILVALLYRSWSFDEFSFWFWLLCGLAMSGPERHRATRDGPIGGAHHRDRFKPPRGVQQAR